MTHSAQHPVYSGEAPESCHLDYIAHEVYSGLMLAHVWL